MHVVTVHYAEADQTAEEIQRVIDRAQELANSDGGEWVDLDWDRNWAPSWMTINGVTHWESGAPEADIALDVQHYLDLAINGN